MTYKEKLQEVREKLQEAREKVNEFEALLASRDQEIIDRAVHNNTPVVVSDTIEQPITEKEACQFLKKSRQTLRMWRYSGIIRSYRINGRIYYKKSELLAALQEC
jgi:hypothetical protein